MGLNHSPKVVTNGLVFCTDMGNTGKSWKGKPTTNSVTNADVMSGWTNYYRTTASSTFLTEFGTIGYRFINQPSWNGIYKSITIPATGTYTFSARFRYFGGSSNNNGATVYISGWGGADSPVAIDKSKVGVWQNISITLNCTNTSFIFYIISYGGTDNGTGNPDFSSWEVTMPQAEAGTFATPFVAGTRTTTQALLDLTKQNTITATSLTYNSNNTFSFDGTNNYAPIGTTGFPFGSSPGTLSVWCKTNTITGGWSFAISYGTAGTGTSRFLGINGSTFYFGGYGGVDISASGVPLNTWFNMVGVYDGTNAFMYINGALVSGPTARSWNTVANNAQIGRQTNSIEYWNGTIDKALVYNVALTAAEIQQNFNAHRGRYGV